MLINTYALMRSGCFIGTSTLGLAHPPLENPGSTTDLDPFTYRDGSSISQTYLSAIALKYDLVKRAEHNFLL